MFRPTTALRQKTTQAHSLSRRPLHWQNRVGAAEGSCKKQTVAHQKVAPGSAFQTLQCNIIQPYSVENLVACTVAWTAVLVVAFCTDDKSL